MPRRPYHQAAHNQRLCSGGVDTQVFLPVANVWTIGNILKYLFPVPKDDSKRVITFSNENDFISFRHHNYTKDGRDINLEEIGPRFELRPYQIRLGTLEQETAENEWVFKPYANTSKKRRLL